MRQTQTYRDVDINFSRHPTSHDVTTKSNDEAIKAAVRNLVLTVNYERPFHPEIGSRIRAMLFEPITPMLWGMLKQEITNLINTYEPRVTLLDVITTYLPDENTVNAQIIFEVVGTNRVNQTAVTLERSR